MEFKKVEYKPMKDVVWKEYYKIDDPAIKYFAKLSKVTIEEAYQGLNEYTSYVYENWGEDTNEERHYINLHYDTGEIEEYKKYKDNKSNNHINFACWDRSGYGGVYAISNKSKEHAINLGKKCFTNGSGCVNED